MPAACPPRRCIEAYTLTATNFEVDFGFKDANGQPLLTSALGYDGIFPGPAIYVQQGVQTLVRIVNDIFCNKTSGGVQTNPPPSKFWSSGVWKFYNFTLTTHLHGSGGGGRGGRKAFMTPTQTHAYSYTPAHTHVRARRHTRARTHACTHARTHVRTPTRAHTCLPARPPARPPDTRPHPHLPTTRAHTHTHAHMYACPPPQRPCPPLMAGHMTPSPPAATRTTCTPTTRRSPCGTMTTPTCTPPPHACLAWPHPTT